MSVEPLMTFTAKWTLQNHIRDLGKLQLVSSLKGGLGLRKAEGEGATRVRARSRCSQDTVLGQRTD